MAPPSLSGVGKYSGLSIWGQMVLYKNYLYVATGQLYQSPPAVAACLVLNPTNLSCIADEILFDSIVKIRVPEGKPERGQIVGSYQTLAADTWTAACLLGYPGCQAGPSFDFDATNIMISEKSKTLFFTTKQGMLYSLDLDLNFNWARSYVNGSIFGGYQFQGALDDDKKEKDIRIFLPNNNGYRYNFTLPNGNITNTGSIVSYMGNGTVEWITPVPGGGPLGDTAYGALALTNKLIVASTRYQGIILFLNKKTGQILRTLQTAGSISSAPAIANKAIYYPVGPGSTAISFNRPMVLQNVILKIGLP